MNIAGNMAATATHGANDGWRRDWREKLTPSEVSFMQGGIKKGRGGCIAKKHIAKSTAALFLFFWYPKELYVFIHVFVLCTMFSAEHLVLYFWNVRINYYYIDKIPVIEAHCDFFIYCVQRGLQIWCQDRQSVLTPLYEVLFTVANIPHNMWQNGTNKKDPS